MKSLRLWETFTFPPLKTSLLAAAETFSILKRIYFKIMQNPGSVHVQERQGASGGFGILIVEAP